jgi:hypothetical protein
MSKHTYTYEVTVAVEFKRGRPAPRCFDHDDPRFGDPGDADETTITIDHNLPECLGEGIAHVEDSGAVERYFSEIAAEDDRDRDDDTMDRLDREEHAFEEQR